MGASDGEFVLAEVHQRVADELEGVAQRASIAGGRVGVDLSLIHI